MLSSDRVDKMGVRTKIAVLTLVATWVLVQLCLYFHSYGYNYSEVRYENCEESVWDASSQEERILALDNSRKEQGMVHTLRGYWRDFVSLFGGAKPGGGESVLIDSGKVIIYAKYRTGSTFTSQFFFEHRNISYMFEPLRLEAHPDQPMVDDANGIIWDMLQCEFETNRTERILSWWMDRVVFCQITGQTPGCVHGKNVPLEKALRHCNKAGIQAVKVIRIQNIWQLEEFLQQQVKVVHVVRDPRGVAHSRWKLHRHHEYEGQLDHRSQEYCQQAVDDINYMRRQMSLDERLVRHLYHIVRYEDMARETRREMDKLYKFLGMPPDDNLLHWVDTIEKNAGTSSSKNANKGYEFGTDRADPAYTAVAWRKSMSFQTVGVVQENCREFMEIAGYLPFTKTNDLRNFSLPVLGTFDEELILKGPKIKPTKVKKTL